MFIGVIRGDLPGPILLQGLEPVSQYNPSTEPRGQEVYLSRPTVAEVEGVLADATSGAGAVMESSDISGGWPLTINGANDDLLLRSSPTPSPFVTVLVPQAVYANLADLIAAVNTVLGGTGVSAREGLSSGDRIAFESDTKGVDSFVENDVTANSTANTPLGLPNGAERDMPTAATYITDLLPVGGPLDVRVATINGVGGGNNANALSLIPPARGTQAAMANAIAPQVADTPVAVDSFISGELNDLLNANFNPDTRRRPPLADGAAIEVVQDDGNTAFVADEPIISSATLDSPNPGDVTIAGTNLSAVGTPNAERDETVVQFIGTGTPVGGDLVIPQRLIISNGGSVAITAIVIPAALNPNGFVTTDTQVQVQWRSYASNVEALA